MSCFCYTDVDTLTHEGNLVNLMIIEITHIIRMMLQLSVQSFGLLKAEAEAKVEEQILANLEVKVLCYCMPNQRPLNTSLKRLWSQIL